VRRQKGTALLEVIVIGFAVVLMVLPVIGTVARLAEAHSDVQMAARDGAIWVARHGGDPPEVDGVDVSVIKRSVVVEVVATREVDLVGVLGATVGRTVQATVRMPVSNYRSAP
jgi:hypothetical protein